MCLFSKDFNVRLVKSGKARKDKKGAPKRPVPTLQERNRNLGIKTGKENLSANQRTKQKDDDRRKRKTATFTMDHNAKAQEARSLLLTYQQSRIRIG